MPIGLKYDSQSFSDPDLESFLKRVKHLKDGGKWRITLDTPYLWCLPITASSRKCFSNCLAGRWWVSVTGIGSKGICIRGVCLLQERTPPISEGRGSLFAFSLTPDYHILTIWGMVPPSNRRKGLNPPSLVLYGQNVPLFGERFFCCCPRPSSHETLVQGLFLSLSILTSFHLSQSSYFLAFLK